MFLPLCRGISSKVKRVGDGSLSLVCLQRLGSQVTGNQRKGEKVCLADETGCQEEGGESEPTSARKFPESALSSSAVTAETVIRRGANAETARRSATSQRRGEVARRQREGRGTEDGSVRGNWRRNDMHERQSERGMRGGGGGGAALPFTLKPAPLLPALHNGKLEKNKWRERERERGSLSPAGERVRSEE